MASLSHRASNSVYSMKQRVARVHLPQLILAGTACIACAAGSTQRYGVRPSVCLSQHGRTAANALLQVRCCGPRQAGAIDRLLQRRRAAGECGQWHVVSVRTSPNTDLLIVTPPLWRLLSFNSGACKGILSLICQLNRYQTISSPIRL